ncbi:uncharacterized protein LOC133038932 [Cannabis sativa]|uniref:uncharacterized protein LOC133038932 n=1 Tax=Cannabis sativa TaxID=3483 RepID=UPI0029CA1458|nr:uncharacterized protein LOC133038932 [Cannabis sativa]
MHSMLSPHAYYMRSDSYDDKDNNVRYFCHQRPMNLVHEHDDSKNHAKCFVCQSVFSNSSSAAYSCSSPYCKNFLHYSCANFQSKINQHPSHHSHHPLILQFSKPRSCNLCCKKNRRLIFRCDRGCNFNLCTNCVVLNRMIRCQSHYHLLCFVEKASYEGVCHACQKSYTQWSGHHHLIPNEINQTKSFLFRCMECNFNLHFICGPLPFIIKYDYHIHALTLVDHLSDEDHYDELYCDVCEQPRHPFFRVYYCKECNYTAHIHCLFDEIMKVIKRDSNDDVKLMAFGETKWTEQIDTKNASEQTLEEFLSETLTNQDKKILNSPFAYHLSSHDKTLVDARHSFYERNTSPLFDHQLRLIENIYQVCRFPSFSSGDFQNFWRKLQYYRPKEGLKVDEEYLRQKIVDINGYKVPITLAHILNTLFHQYGESHLFGKWVSKQTTGVKSVLATTLCVVCDQICRTKIEDVTAISLKNWYFYLNAITGTTFTNQMCPSSFINKVVKRFFWFEAIRYEKEVDEKLELKIKDLEAELEKYKKTHDTFKVQMSKSLEKVEDRISDALRLKGKNVDEIISVSQLLETDYYYNI